MIELKISWDGSAPGLAEHRLSIGSFALPLRTLLIAARRTANNMIREAADRKESDVGRMANEADRIDIQIVELNEGSTAPSCIVSVSEAPGQRMLFWPEGLAEDAIDRLLVDMECESRGIQRNRGVRDYFKQLPPGITKQDYVLKVNGSVRREVHIGAVSIASDLRESPYLIEVTGSVIGVGFEPGRHFVKLKGSDGSEITLSATANQVDKALEHRSSNVRILALAGTGARKLLRLQPESESPVRLDVNTFVFQKWNHLMARLAQ